MKKVPITLSYRLKLFLVVSAGFIFGGGFLFLYLLRAHTYLGDDPSACVNCHLMGAYYDTWAHGSHGRNTTCNDCHVPHENMFRKYLFKAMDGTRHTAVFLTNTEPQVIQAIPQSSEVIMNNCIRCHTQLNTEFVKDGRLSYMQTQVGEGKACWDCHKEVGHGKVSLSTTPNALVPYPESPVPQWLKKILKK